MKTIFLTVFQGVEARNILRTDIFNILKSEKNIRLVLFVNSKERKEYLLKDFNGDQIFYEVVDNYKTPSFNKVFTFLKFNLLNTSRMDIRRKNNLAENKNYFIYYIKLIFNRLFARSIIRKIVRFLDFYLVKDFNFKIYFEKYNPDLVILGHLFGDIEISLLREAKKRKVKSIGIINSWDKLVSRGIIRLLPDYLIVHNNIMKKEAISYADFDSHRIYVTGIPHYDIFFNNKPSAKEKFYKKIGADSDKKILLVCPTGQFYSDNDVDMINLLTKLQKEEKISKNLQILVRFPPNDFVDVSNLLNKELLLFDQPGVRFSSKRGVNWDMNYDDNQHLLDTLYYSSIIICPPSSLSVDAAVFDLPIINLKFPYKGKRFDRQNINLFYEADHYKKLIKTKGVKIVESTKELVEWINIYLKNPKIDSEKRQKIIEEQCQYIDGKSGQRMANIILDKLK